MQNHGSTCKELARSIITSMGTPAAVPYVTSATCERWAHSTTGVTFVAPQSMKRSSEKGAILARKTGLKGWAAYVASVPGQRKRTLRTGLVALVRSIATQRLPLVSTTSIAIRFAADSAILTLLSGKLIAPSPSHSTT